LNVLVTEFENPAAGEANEVAVGGPGAPRLEMAVVFSQVDRADQAAPDQQVERPVDRR
jgi:hypothetical protein